MAQATPEYLAALTEAVLAYAAVKARCVYDNPLTMAREWWEDGQRVASVSSSMVVTLDRGLAPWNTGRLLGDASAMDTKGGPVMNGEPLLVQVEQHGDVYQVWLKMEEGRNATDQPNSIMIGQGTTAAKAMSDAAANLWATYCHISGDGMSNPDQRGDGIIETGLGLLGLGLLLILLISAVWG